MLPQLSATTCNAAVDILAQVLLDLCEHLLGIYTKNGIAGGFQLRECLLQVTQDHSSCICHLRFYFYGFKEDHGLVWLGQGCLGIYLLILPYTQQFTEFFLYVFDGVKMNILSFTISHFY